MAYFDSEKNKAMWAKRLSMLEQERDRRKATGYRPTDRKQVQENENAPVKEGVRIISFEELVAKEEKRHMAQKSAGMQRSRQMQPAPEMGNNVRAM